MTSEKQSKTRCQTEPGFTLVEVMVSLVIMLMVVTIAFSGLRIGLNAWERGGRAVDEMDRRATVERLIRRQLALSYPLKFTSNDRSFVLFRGTNSRIEFVADYSLSDGRVDFRKIDYATNKGQFLYAEKPLFGYVPQEDEPPPTGLLATFKDVSFEFLETKEGINPVWIPDWELGNGVPVAVRVHVDDDTFIVRMVNR